jgi:hypothetical protein
MGLAPRSLFTAATRLGRDETVTRVQSKRRRRAAVNTDLTASRLFLNAC